MEIQKLPMFYGASPEIFKRARELRSKMTVSEKLLWEALTNNPFIEFKFRRQHPIGQYIVDFYCHGLRLVIEVDGKIHLQKEVRENDKQREDELKSMGLEIIRFRNEEIIQEMDLVITKILSFVRQNDNNK